MNTITITLENFDEITNQNDKPVLLDFWAPWCGPCRMLGPIIDEIATENDSIIVGKVNVDEQPELASRYGIMSIPTIIVMKDGKVANQTMGVQPKAAILSLLQ